MLQLQNNTPFATDFALFPDEQGVDTLYTVVKATFNIGKQWTLVKHQSAPEMEDIYWGEAGESSLQKASDYHTGKPFTDIIMTGNACSHQGQSVQQLDVNLSVATLSKTVRVFGDRVWKAGTITSPLPFTNMPLVYEKAYGGMHLVDNEIESSEARNPVGTGFRGECSQQEMEGMLLPNLENPADLISAFDDQPEPACFAYVSAGWKPRVGYSGTYDEQWKNNRSPYLPLDFDRRFFNMAHRDLIYPGYLTGGEQVQISNMHPAGNLKFKVPVVKFLGEVGIKDRKEEIHFNLETLLLEPNRLQLSMVWRAKFNCGRNQRDIKVINLNLIR